MTTIEKSSIIVELYDLPLTGRKDDRYGRVVTTRSLTEDDLISIAVSRRTDLSATSLKASMSILGEIAIEQIANGASVSFGLGYFNLGVNGVFIGNDARWDSAIHSLSVRVAPKAELRNAVKASKVDVRGMAASGSVINTVTDVTTGEVNCRLTPGGGVKLTGTKIKIDGDELKVGITLTNKATSEVIKVPATSLLLNDPSKITFIVPATLVNGDYKLSITTHYSSPSHILREARTFSSDYILNVYK
jgi:hypothetical protein